MLVHSTLFSLMFITVVVGLAFILDWFLVK